MLQVEVQREKQVTADHERPHHGNDVLEHRDSDDEADDVNGGRPQPEPKNDVRVPGCVEQCAAEDLERQNRTDEVQRGGYGPTLDPVMSEEGDDRFGGDKR